jgi:diphosphomevalonate decarboxylase
MSSSNSSTTPDKVTIPPNSVSITCRAPVNIAVIKYWGKRSEELILPINSSLSASLAINSMCAHTQIIASKTFDKNRIWLNHKEESIERNDRLVNVISGLLSRAGDYKSKEGAVLITSQQWKEYKFHIISVNNFPTAAGLASSAAGYACLTACLAGLLHFSESYPGELSAIARLGSGSACRSIYGGWVQWIAGEEKDGKDSIAKQIVDHNYWPEIRIIILVANAAQKETSSTTGMQRSVQTSLLLNYRAKHIVPDRMARMEESIKKRDFPAFGRLTMEDSNQFHATCLDTYPPIFYLNNTSQAVIAAVDAINTYFKQIVAAYTFDAGN